MSRRLRRTGLIYLALAISGMAGALWLAYENRSGTATAVALLPSLAGLYLAWASFRAGATKAAGDRGLREVADQLATAVRGQWEAEAGIRGLYDPRPLPVAWRAAPQQLVEEQGVLRRLVAEQHGGSMSGAPGWTGEPADLAGSGGQLLRIFREQVPTRRLVILGEPGSGKTMLLVRLLLDLIECRDPGTAVPVLFPLSSWDPAEQDLQSWMAHRLVQDFEELAVSSAATLGGLSLARALLAQRVILPLLDGFDELPARARSAALDQINTAVAPGRPVVLTSRQAEYGEAVAPAAGLPRKLVGAAGIELLPLAPEETAAYLCRDAGGPGTPAAARWDRVLRNLGSGGAVAQAFSTPLMVFLARTIYNPRTGESLDAVPSPDELLDDSVFPSRASVEAHLLAAFVPAAYRPDPRAPSSWSAPRAARTLRWLARHAERVPARIQAGATDLAWWQLNLALPRWLPLVLAGVLAGTLECAVTWVTVQVADRFPLPTDALDFKAGLAWWAASSGGLLAGLVGGLAGRIPGGLIGASIGAAATAIPHWRPDVAYDLVPSNWEQLTGGLVFGFIGGIMGELTLRPAARRADGARTSGPRRLPWSWCAALAGVAVGIVYGYALTLSEEWSHRRLPPTVGLILFLGLAGGLAVGRRTSQRELIHPAAGVRWSWDWGGLLIGLGGGLAVTAPAWVPAFHDHGFTGGLVSELTLTRGATFFGSVSAAVVLCVYCLAGTITYGIRGTTADLTQAPGPAVLLARDRRTFWRLAWVTALAVGLVVGLAVWCASSLKPEPHYPAQALHWHDVEWVMTMPELARALVSGALVGIAVGIAIAWNQTAAGSFAVARTYLAVRYRLPWRLMTFLADAHEHRGVLRQSGAVYQFRHIELQRHLTADDHGQ